MNILCKVDQTAAIKAGIDAPQSTVQISVNPANLTQAERDALAEVLKDGYDATKKGLEILQYYSGTAPLEVVDPSFEGFRKALAAIMEDRDQKLKVARENVDAEIRQCLETFHAGTTEKHKVFLDRHGNVSGYAAMASREIDVPADWSDPSHLDTATPALLAEYKAAKTERDARRKADIEAALPGLRAELQAKLEEEAEEEAAIQAEYDFLYARLPEDVRERHAAGFVKQGTVKELISGMLRKDAGFSNDQSWKNQEWENSSTDVELTAQQFAALKKVRAKVPKDAEVEVLFVWDEEDHDGETFEVRRRTVAIVSWSEGGVEAKVVVDLNGTLE